MFLETERLLLRKFCDQDFDDFYAFAADREMCRMMGRDDLTDPAAARQNFSWLKEHEERAYAIVLKETGRVIGNLTVTSPAPSVLLHETLRGKRGCSLSFSISRLYQRRGLMTEALRAVIAQLFTVEALDYVNCGHFRFNSASRALQQTLGFSFLFSESHTINGEETECIENVLLR